MIPYGYVDIAPNKNDGIKQFPLKFTPELKKEIFNIFLITDAQNNTPEMNKEICARLDYALKYIK